MVGGVGEARGIDVSGARGSKELADGKTDVQQFVGGRHHELEDRQAHGAATTTQRQRTATWSHSHQNHQMAGRTQSSKQSDGSYRVDGNINSLYNSFETHCHLPFP